MINILGEREDASHFAPRLLNDFGLRKYFDVKCAQTAWRTKLRPNSLTPAKSITQTASRLLFLNID